MRRHDRLAQLAACHSILRQAGIRSLDGYRSATPDRLAALGPYRATIAELVHQGHLDVLRALWPPPVVTWEVARLSLRPADRLLTASRGTPGRVDEYLVKLVYDCADPDDERRAWRWNERRRGTWAASCFG